jgi:hypothetical protein
LFKELKVLLFKTLVEYNSDITLTNKYGHTPCFIAEFNSNNECVHYLMIVETCINLSIKVVKLSRKLRETKSNNDILKAQMDEVIILRGPSIHKKKINKFWKVFFLSEPRCKSKTKLYLCPRSTRFLQFVVQLKCLRVNLFQRFLLLENQFWSFFFILGDCNKQRFYKPKRKHALYKFRIDAKANSRY